MIIADTSGLLALFNRKEPQHEAVRRVVDDRSDSGIVVSPYVVAELDYLVTTRVGTHAEVAVLRELVLGAYELVDFGASDLGRATDVVERYRDQAIGIADASIVVLADLWHTREILTLDRRHFGVLRPLSGGRFSLLPQLR